MKKLATIAATIVLAASSVAAAAPTADAAYLPGKGKCTAWFTLTGVAGKCTSWPAGYQIEPLCLRWRDGRTVYTSPGRYVGAPSTSSRSCPFGTSASGGILWSPTGGNIAWVSR